MIVLPRTTQVAPLLCVLAAFALLSSTVAPAWAASPSEAAFPQGKVVLFLIDRVTLQDLIVADLPHFKRLMAQGAVGLMNPLGARGTGNMRVALTINVGTRADADESAGEVLEEQEIYLTENELAGVVYHRRTGESAKPGNLVNLHRREIMDSNLKSPHVVIVGTLGDLVHQAGGFTATLGNGDTGVGNWEIGKLGNVGARLRYGALMAMDSRGIVDKGSVSRRALQETADAPYGVRTNLRQLFDEFYALYAEPQKALIVIDFGDTYRADVYSWLSAEEVGLQYKQTALKRADALIGRVVRTLNRERDLLLVFSLSVPRLSAGEMLPVMAFGRGIQPGSYLTSGSTKRDGFITPADVTATIGQFLDAPPALHVIGRAVSAVSTTRDRLHRLAQYTRMTVITDRGLRFGAFVFLALLEALVLLASALVVTFPSRVAPKVKAAVRTLLVVTVILPLVIHFGNALLPLSFDFGVASAALRVLILVLFWLACAYFGWGNRFPGHFLYGGLALMLLAVTTQCVSEFNTIFGYSSYYGGRYYGLGNATSAILLGWGVASMSFSAGRISAKELTIWAVWFAFITVIIALPRFGADAGGAVGAVATFAPTWLVAKGVCLSGKKAWRSIAALVLVLVVVVVLVSVLDVRRAPEDRTHLGRLVAEIQEQGIAPLVDMFVTKARVWGRTFGHWHWDVCLVALVLTTAWLLLGLRVRLARLLASRPALNAMLYGGIIGTIVTFLLNDSGPIIAGLMGLYVLSPPLYLLLEEETT